MGRSGRMAVLLGVLAAALVIAWWVPPRLPAVRLRAL